MATEQGVSIPGYEEFVTGFSLEKAAAELLNGDLEKGINACVECCDRHVGQNRVALTCIGQDGREERYTFEQLQKWSAQFANLLKQRGIGPGDRVAGLLPRKLELMIVVLGAWRAGAIYQPLFTAFGPQSIEHRLHGSEARLVVTDSANRVKLRQGAHASRTLVVGDDAEAAENFHAQLRAQPDQFQPVMRKGSDPFQMLFTSGTTGKAKGVMVPLKALVAFGVYMRYAVGLREDDRMWNIADPGWAYGLYYAITGPLLLGHETMFYEGSFTVESTYRIIRERRINNLLGAPTAYRMLMAAGPEAARRVKGQLRVVSSAGEPLNPEVIRWFAEHLDVVVHDHYGQTETGMTICNHHDLKHPLHLGAAGYALPGYRAAIIDADGRELTAGTPGLLALDMSQSPLFFFPGYWRQAEQPFRRQYYPTGDTAELNEDGSISFVGRSDDVITSSGYRIGPFDVESSLIEHPSVAEVAVVGKPDPERTEIVKAFVVLRQGIESSDTLAEELALFVKQRLAAHAYPREIEFVNELPKTPSGKIQRFLLRTQGGQAKAAL
ncbi:MAG: AMP-binding protein [Xanthomonadaceae bacterium]|nr:AMP-binding protein [Xanthomonadaceae bacterium]